MKEMNNPFTRPRTGPMRFPGDIPNMDGVYVTHEAILNGEADEDGPLAVVNPRSSMGRAQMAVLAEDLRPLLDACRDIYSCTRSRELLAEAISHLLSEAGRIERAIK